MNITFGKTSCEFTLQHLDYGQVLGGGRADPHAVLKIIERGSLIGAELRQRNSEKLGIPYNNMIFMKWQQLEYLPEFYTQKINPSDPRSYVESVNRKFKVKCQLLPVGNTSVGNEILITDCQTDSPILYRVATGVNMNLETRKPMPFHEKIRKFYTPQNSPSIEIGREKLPPQCTKLYKKPMQTSCHSYSSQISIRYVDRNNHANQATYSLLCFECLADAFTSEMFGSIGSIFDHKLRRISQLFVKECLRGDEVVTTVWRDSDDPWCFCFHSTKDGNLLCQTEFEFFKPEFILKANL